MKKVLLTIALAAFAFAANAQFVVSGSASFSTNGGSTYGLFETTETGVNNAERNVPNNISNLFTFGPSIGYMLNDKMQVGLGFGLTINYNKNFGVNRINPATGVSYAYSNPNLDAEDWRKVSSVDFTIAPYFRYYFMEVGKFNFFCQANVKWTINGRPTTHVFATKIDANATYGPAVALDAIDTTYTGTYVATMGMYGEKVEVKKHTETDMELGIEILPGVSYKFNDNFSADMYFGFASVNFSHAWQKEYLETEHVPAVGTAWTEKETYRNRDNNFRFGLNFDDLRIQNFLNFRIGFNYHF